MTIGAAKRAIVVIEFFQAVMDPDNQFLAYALGMGGLASIAFGIIGTFVTIKRISYLARGHFPFGFWWHRPGAVSSGGGRESPGSTPSWAQCWRL